MSSVEGPQVPQFFYEINNFIHHHVSQGVSACQSTWAEQTGKYSKFCETTAAKISNARLTPYVEATMQIIPLAVGALVLSNPLGTTFGVLKLTGIALTAACLSEVLKEHGNDAIFRGLAAAAAIHTVSTYLAETGFITTVASAILTVGCYYASKGAYVAESRPEKAPTPAGTPAKSE